MPIAKSHPTPASFIKLSKDKQFEAIVAVEKSLDLPLITQKQFEKYSAEKARNHYKSLLIELEKESIVERNSSDLNKTNLNIAKMERLYNSDVPLETQFHKMEIESVADQIEYHLSSVHGHWINLTSREIWIHGKETDPSFTDGEEPGVEYNMATKVIKNLHILMHHSRTKPVTIHLHSCGGVVEEGLAIYDAIRAMPYKTTMISYTHARSMSSYILQSADVRLLLPNSCFMFHEGEFYIGGTQRQVYTGVDWSKKHYDKVLMNIYVDSLKKKGIHKDKSRKQISDLLLRAMRDKEDVYLNAKDAIKWGFADEILRKF